MTNLKLMESDLFSIKKMELLREFVSEMKVLQRRIKFGDDQLHLLCHLDLQKQSSHHPC